MFLVASGHFYASGRVVSVTRQQMQSEECVTWDSWEEVLAVSV
jgi:hypothetical protein